MNRILTNPLTWNWEYINTFAPWLSAVGIFAAVWIALRLSLAERRPRLVITAGLVPAMPDNPNQSIFIKAENLGLRDVQVTGIWLKIGRWKPTVFPINWMQHLAGCATYPHHVQALSSEEYRFLAAFTDDQVWMIRGLLATGNTRLWRSMMVVFITPGRQITARVDAKLRDWLLAELQVRSQ
jgi:hypothetical protein